MGVVVYESTNTCVPQFHFNYSTYSIVPCNLLAIPFFNFEIIFLYPMK
jgi:hypothetical protein